MKRFIDKVSIKLRLNKESNKKMKDKEIDRERERESNNSLLNRKKILAYPKLSFCVLKHIFIRTLL